MKERREVKIKEGERERGATDSFGERHAFPYI